MPNKLAVKKKIYSLDELKGDSAYTVIRLVSSRYYVYEDLPIVDLVELFNEQSKEVNAVGVLTLEGRFKGIIIRKELMNLISRPYGLDILKKKPASKVTVHSEVFDCNCPLATVADELRDVMKQSEESFYALVDGASHFMGIFSTRDLLIQMSEQNRKDMNLARTVQNSMVQNRSNILSFGLEVATYFSPAHGVGGDFYLTRKISEHEWIIMLCDVSGKGVAASIVTAMLYGVSRTYNFRKGLKSFVRTLNDMIFDTFGGDRFLTGIFIKYNEESGKASILDMGHSYLTLVRGGKVYSVASGKDNLPLGICEDIKPQIGSIQLQYDDILVTLTDGLVEQKNPEGEEYDMNRTHEIISQYDDSPLEEICNYILDDFESHRNNTPYHDDMTFMLLRYPRPDDE